MPRHPDTCAPRAPRGGLSGADVFALGVAVFATGCTPDYPSCETDKDCHAKEFCVAQQVPAVPRLERLPGRATPARRASATRSPATAAARRTAPPTRSASPTSARPARTTRSARAAALRQGRLPREEALQDRERLRAGRGLRQRLLHARRRRPRRRPRSARWTPVFFDFNESALTTEATAALARDADCLKKVGRAAHAGRPHRPARHAGVQPRAVREARAVGARPPGPPGRRRHQADGAAARLAGREGDR